MEHYFTRIFYVNFTQVFQLPASCGCHRSNVMLADLTSSNGHFYFFISGVVQFVKLLSNHATAQFHFLFIETLICSMICSI